MTTSPFAQKWSEMLEDDDSFCFDMSEAKVEEKVCETPVKQIQSGGAPMPSTRGKGQLAADDFDGLFITPIKADSSLLAHEVLVECSIPYRMRSLCSMVPALQQHNNSTCSVLSEAAAATGRTSSTPMNRCQRAIDAIQKALRENNDEMKYNDLMKACNWRVRFQPLLGSLFTFLKKQPNCFSYKHAVVRLVPREAIVNELLAMSWK